MCPRQISLSVSVALCFVENSVDQRLAPRLMLLGCEFLHTLEYADLGHPPRLEQE